MRGVMASVWTKILGWKAQIKEPKHLAVRVVVDPSAMFV
jgi:hypothetical protein